MIFGNLYLFNTTCYTIVYELFILYFMPLIMSEEKIAIKAILY